VIPCGLCFMGAGALSWTGVGGVGFGIAAIGFAAFGGFCAGVAIGMDSSPS